jgi:hypothetical protein
LTRETCSQKLRILGQRSERANIIVNLGLPKTLTQHGSSGLKIVHQEAGLKSCATEPKFQPSDTSKQTYSDT